MMALTNSARLEVSLAIALGGSAGGIDTNHINANVTQQTCQQPPPSRGCDRGELVKIHPSKQRGKQTDLGDYLPVNWNQTCRTVSSGAVWPGGPVAEEQCWVPLYSREVARSGPHDAAAWLRIWIDMGGHRARSTPMPVTWPSTWRSASGRASTRLRRAGCMSRYSFVSPAARRSRAAGGPSRSGLVNRRRAPAGRPRSRRRSASGRSRAAARR